MKEFILKSNGHVEYDGAVLHKNYVKVCIQNGESVQICDEEGSDITVEVLVDLIGKDRETALDLISLLDVLVLENIIRAGSVADYRRRQSC